MGVRLVVKMMETHKVEKKKARTADNFIVSETLISATLIL